jgi:hypothetical protein
MANSWLWRTDMSKPSDKQNDDVEAESGGDVHAGRERVDSDNGASSDQPAGEFPYPGLGYTKQTFRERAREQRERDEAHK